MGCSGSATKNNELKNTKVVVTGVTGFVGSWVTKLLLEEGNYKVRGTVRDPNNQEKLEPLKKAFGDKFNELELVAADLNDQKSLEEAVKGCSYLFHVASPFPIGEPKDPKDVIDPAVNGVKFAMNAAIKAGLKKVILTSSCVCVYDYGSGATEVDEKSFTAIGDYTDTYSKSKILAEQAAWKIWEENKGKIELVTINPCLIIGPPLIMKGFTSGDIVKAILLGGMPELMQMYVNWVDVREVAAAHLKAVNAKDGNRYIIAGENYKMKEISVMLKEWYGQYGYNVVTEESSQEYPFSKKQNANNKKSQSELGIKYRPIKESLTDMIETMIRNNLVPDLKK